MAMGIAATRKKKAATTRRKGRKTIGRLAAVALLSAAACCCCWTFGWMVRLQLQQQQSWTWPLSTINTAVAAERHLLGQQLEEFVRKERRSFPTASSLAVVVPSEVRRGKEQEEEAPLRRLPGVNDDATTASGTNQLRGGAAVGSNDDGGKSPYAYAFLVGRCGSNKNCTSDTGVGTTASTSKYNDNDYAPYVYSVLVAAYILRREGSTADIVLFIDRCGRDFVAGSAKRKPDDDFDDDIGGLVRALRGMRISIRTIPQQRSFYQLQLQKFRILGLTEYRRVLYLDSDLMPTTNLDYLFEYSDPKSERQLQQPPILQENLVVVGKYAPVNGGFFMLTPHVGDLELVNRLIRDKELKQLQQQRKLFLPEAENRTASGDVTRDGRSAKNGFDVKLGWGGTTPIGSWKSLLSTGFDWRFNAADGDQGLLWYWVRNVQRKVSIQTIDEIEHWVASESAVTAASVSSKMKEENALVRIPDKLSQQLPHQDPLWCWGVICEGLWSNFVHFYGSQKPWNVGYPFTAKAQEAWSSTAKTTTLTTAMNSSTSSLGTNKYYLSTFKERIDIQQALKRARNKKKQRTGIISNEDRPFQSAPETHRWIAPSPKESADAKYASEIHYWYATLKELNEEYDIGIDVENVTLQFKKTKKKVIAESTSSKLDFVSGTPLTTLLD